jgi:uncharacterized protein
MNTRKFHLPGEAALLIVLLINPLAIDLMSKSVFGISTISSVPLILSTAFPVFSFGTWNYIFQTLLVITLMVLKRSFCPGYLFSFVVGIGFGKMIDVHNTWVTLLPNVLSLNVVCFFRISSDVLRHLPRQQLPAADCPDRYFSAGSVGTSA